MQRNFVSKKTALKPSTRLVSEASVEQEWLYLVNETLEGEKCIVPLLGKILKNPIIANNKSLFDDLSKQHAEEVQHVRLFNGLVGQEKIAGSGYRQELYNYVESLPTVTLKLFALQGMLEGFALGALRYRLRFFENSFSQKVDARALSEELDHVDIAFDHFKYLQAEEGHCTKGEFLQVSRDVNKILSNSFSSKNIAHIFSESFDVIIENPSKIDESDIMREFKSISIKSVVENKNKFINFYLSVANA